MTVQIHATRMIPVATQFVSVVTRGASRKTWKTLKHDTGTEGDAFMTLHVLLARKAALDEAITEAQRGATPLDITLATKGVTPSAVRTLVFNAQRFTASKAEAWALEHGWPTSATEVADDVVQCTVKTEATVKTDEADFDLCDIAPGITAVYARAGDMVSKSDAIAGMFDTTLTGLLASIADGTATPATAVEAVRKIETELAAMVGAEGTMLSNEELVAKNEALAATNDALVAKIDLQGKLLAALAQKAGITTDAAGNPMSPPMADMDADGKPPKGPVASTEIVDVVNKADLAEIVRTEVAAAIAPVMEMAAKADARVAHIEKSIAAPRRGAAATGVLERGSVGRDGAKVVKEDAGAATFDSAFPWGK